MALILKCVACNNTKSTSVESSLEGDALEMFNFVCCLEISQVCRSIKSCENIFDCANFLCFATICSLTTRKESAKSVTTS